VVITHSTGFREPNVQELTKVNREKILASGAKIITTAHDFGGGEEHKARFETVFSTTNNAPFR
jgi:hypothetical protein